MWNLRLLIPKKSNLWKEKVKSGITDNPEIRPDAWIAFRNKIPGLIPLLKEGDGQRIADYFDEGQKTG